MQKKFWGLTSRGREELKSYVGVGRKLIGEQ